MSEPLEVVGTGDHSFAPSALAAETTHLGNFVRVVGVMPETEDATH